MNYINSTFQTLGHLISWLNEFMKGHHIWDYDLECAQIVLPKIQTYRHIPHKGRTETHTYKQDIWNHCV